jgi:hypothetical protein
MVRFLTKQMAVIDGEKLPIVAGCWAIFGHGNVAGIGEALYQVRDSLPTYRAHNEQGMALAATAYAKAMFRRRLMACTTSIGPGALNMITARRSPMSIVCRSCCCPATSLLTAYRTRSCNRSRTSRTEQFRPMTVSDPCRAISIGSTVRSSLSRRCSAR